MRSRWSDKIAKSLNGCEALLYASRLIGQEADLVLWGGGNSSVKTTEPDHIGREVRLLWIKGSGSDMKTMTERHLTPLRLNELLHLVERQDMTDEEMVPYLSCCVINPTAPKPSIETLLHAFLPAPHIYHTHADAICTLTDTANSERIIERVYGDDVALIPYIRPGFRMAKMVALAYRRNPALRAIILDKHGLVTWGPSAKAAYMGTIQMVTEAQRMVRARARLRPLPFFTRTNGSGASAARAAMAARVLPILRGAVSQSRRVVFTSNDSPMALAFVNDPRAASLSQIGPFTPDHMLHTKSKPLFLKLPDTTDPQRIARAIHQALDRYRAAYRRYFDRYKTPGVTMLDPNPRIILIPGLGMFATGKDRRAARIAHDLYTHTMPVILNASAINRYVSLTPQALCDFEYWPLENFKLTLLPPEKPLSRRIALVTGAAGAIGKAISARLLAEGASVILTDIHEPGIRALSAELNQRSGEENTVAIPMNVADEASVSRAFEKSLLAFGGLDILVSNAGIARCGSVDQLSLKDWQASLAVNATGHFLVCREAMRAFQQQALGGTIVVVATKNVVAPGKSFGAYSASKAAQAQLSRILAIEGAEFGVRVNMVNPDAVLDGSGIWSPEIRKGRAKAYGIRVDQLDEHCISRSLLKVKVSSEDVAESVLFLASDRSAKTTGAMIPVDGGVREAFPR
jgi:rhamnulose-1-phosphate aldolase/alcohol dehydrogenase